jgi:hypothetical protein
MGTLGRTDQGGDAPSAGDQALGEQPNLDVESRIEEYEEIFDIEDRFTREGRFTQRIDRLASAVPSATWLVLAGGSLAAALTLKLMRHHQAANFVGEWVPTFLLIGVYNKLVKLAESDRRSAMGY